MLKIDLPLLFICVIVGLLVCQVTDTIWIGSVFAGICYIITVTLKELHNGPK